jgi:phage terminase large subunit GpA-like protein
LSSVSTYRPQFEKMFQRNPQLSNIKPSAWSEQNIIIPGKGKLNYDFNPYCREVIDTLAPDHPARKIAVMKGSQITFSSGVIMPYLGYTIKEDPANTYYMVGHTDLIQPAVEKLDTMITGAQLADYISYQLKRKKNQKSGDTDEMKYFPNGYIKLGSPANHKSIAQVDLVKILLDDFEAMKGRSKDTGAFQDLIEMRAAAALNTYKLLMVSTPLLSATSNIEPAYLAGDQRGYHLHCPCCHEPIIIKWTVTDGELMNQLTEEKAKGNGGIHYEMDNHGRLVKRSVGYVCYKCAGFFTDKNKQHMLREGLWIPRALPISEDYYSYKIPSLYAPVGMFNWAHYAGKHLEACPPGQPRNEAKMQVLVNTCWGETYEPPAEETAANSIMKNQRSYEPWTLPEGQSIADGNGRIVLLTLSADMNGKMKGFHSAQEDDVRLDWELLAWAESGANYSIAHGSIGTFIPLEGQSKEKVDRERWSYDPNHPRCVWPEMDKILGQVYQTDTGRRMIIGIAGLDSGNYTNFAYAYQERSPHSEKIYCIKGEKEQEYVRIAIDAKPVRDSRERPGRLFIITVGLYKDDISRYMRLNWQEGNEQPPNFMNYPQSRDGLYQLKGYFEHYESEHRTTKTDNGGKTLYLWKKKRTSSQNHFWDCRVYNLAMRDVLVMLIGKERKEKTFEWKDFVAVVTGGNKPTTKTW